MDGQSLVGPVYTEIRNTEIHEPTIRQKQSCTPRGSRSKTSSTRCETGFASPPDEHTTSREHTIPSRGERRRAPELGAACLNSNPVQTPPILLPPLLHRRNILPLMHLRPNRELRRNMPYNEPNPYGLLRPMESEVGSGWGTMKEAEMGQPEQEEFLNNWVKIRNYLKEPFCRMARCEYTSPATTHLPQY